MPSISSSRLAGAKQPGIAACASLAAAAMPCAPPTGGLVRVCCLALAAPTLPPGDWRRARSALGGTPRVFAHFVRTVRKTISKDAVGQEAPYAPPRRHVTARHSDARVPSGSVARRRSLASRSSSRCSLALARATRGPPRAATRARNAARHGSAFLRRDSARRRAYGRQHGGRGAALLRRDARQQRRPEDNGMLRGGRAAAAHPRSLAPHPVARDGQVLRLRRAAAAGHGGPPRAGPRLVRQSFSLQASRTPP